jgi:hypothetical protein
MWWILRCNRDACRRNLWPRTDELSPRAIRKHFQNFERIELKNATVARIQSMRLLTELKLSIKERSKRHTIQNHEFYDDMEKPLTGYESCNAWLMIWIRKPAATRQRKQWNNSGKPIPNSRRKLADGLLLQEGGMESKRNNPNCIG